MGINWNLLDTQYPSTLASLFNPSDISQRHTAISNNEIKNQLSLAQLMQGANQLNRAPELQRREDEQYQQGQDKLRRGQQDEMQIRQVLQATGGDPAKAVQSLLQNGSPRSLEMAAKLHSLMPKPAEPYTLSEGAVRFGPDNKQVAQGLPKTTAHDGSPSFAPIQGSDSYWVFDRRTGKYTRPPGAPLAPTANPSLQGNISYEKAVGKERGESTSKASIALPQNIQEAENTVKLVDELLAHPGLDQAVGKSSILGIQKIPGTDAKAFMTRLDQLRGKQFLQAFETLKGGGQITEVEGNKATQAIARMDNASTEAEFKNAAREFQQIIKQGVERAKVKAGEQSKPTLPNSGTAIKGAGKIKFLGFE